MVIYQNGQIKVTNQGGLWELKRNGVDLFGDNDFDDFLDTVKEHFGTEMKTAIRKACKALDK